MAITKNSPRTRSSSTAAASEQPPPKGSPAKKEEEPVVDAAAATATDAAKEKGSVDNKTTVEGAAAAPLPPSPEKETAPAEATKESNDDAVAKAETPVEETKGTLVAFLLGLDSASAVTVIVIMTLGYQLLLCSNPSTTALEATWLLDSVDKC